MRGFIDDCSTSQDGGAQLRIGDRIPCGVRREVGQYGDAKIAPAQTFANDPRGHFEFEGRSGRRFLSRTFGRLR
ncbi:MAG: hypothetical protein IPK63_19450 [Candidatus Competibacteraceae bacterium]|nr:hypothetical protein [Candidatus Competibacteraceae bacterium]